MCVVYRCGGPSHRVALLIERHLLLQGTYDFLANRFIPLTIELSTALRRGFFNFVLVLKWQHVKVEK